MPQTGRADTTWRTSSYSGDAGSCVQVAVTAPAVGVRDSKRPQAGALTFTPHAWHHLLRIVRT